MGGRWEREDLERAAAMNRDGMTFADIAKAFGVKRAAISGIASRNRDLFPKIEGRAGGPKPKPKPVARPAAKADGKAGAKSGKGSGRLSALGVTVRKEGVAGTGRDLSVHKLPGVETVRFADLASDQCSFPLTKFDGQDGPGMPCCGARAEEGKRWCKAHMRVVYRPRGEVVR